MNTTRRLKIKNVVRNMGARSIILSMLVFIITLAVTGVVGFQFYASTRENIRLRGKVNAVQSAKAFDGYLLVRKNTVILAGHVVDEMVRQGQSHEEILAYLTAESLSI